MFHVLQVNNENKGALQMKTAAGCWKNTADEGLRTK